MRQEEETKRIAEEKKAKEALENNKFKKLDKFFTQGIVQKAQVSPNKSKQ